MSLQKWEMGAYLYFSLVFNSHVFDNNSNTHIVPFTTVHARILYEQLFNLTA